MASGKIDRREALRLLASASIASAFACTPNEVVSAHQAVSGGTSERMFFTDHEFDTVTLLGDIFIPRDERSGSASDAGVPEWIDFMTSEEPERQVVMRGGLAWIDALCEKRFDRRFLDAGDDERTALLDEIAYPDRAAPELSHGVEFVNRFRDLVATGFFTSKMGFEDLDYRGNTFVTEWTGCPDEALRKLGVDRS
ncbi:MAG: gluconate 2-dehydrogenase subunit 3 family protein [Acidobacteria bacterium]|nr:MAG: gluconate 2-dehydrogenase subunit 3 family protein [Acidobacteriota bacterium]